MAPQFTDSVTAALEQAFIYAQEHRQTEIVENHLIKTLLDDQQGYFATLARSLNLDPDLLKTSVEQAVIR